MPSNMKPLAQVSAQEGKRYRDKYCFLWPCAGVSTIILQDARFFRCAVKVEKS